MISKIEHGKKDKITVSTLTAFAEALVTSEAYLMGWTDDPEITREEFLQKDNNDTEIIAADTGSVNNDSIIFHEDTDNTTPNTTILPILGEVAAGTGLYADNDVIGYEDVPKSWISDTEPHVLLRVHGDSMYPKFEEDDLLLIRCQTSVNSGDYAIALIDDDNGVVKRVMYGKDWIELQSVNPMYAPRRFEGADVQRIRIFGLVKKSIRNY